MIKSSIHYEFQGHSKLLTTLFQKLILENYIGVKFNLIMYLRQNLGKI